MGLPDSTVPNLAASDAGLFGAFRERPSRRNLKWALGVVAGLCLVEIVVLWSGRGVTQVVTRQGIRSLKRGMTVEDVRRVMGRPLATASAPDGLECFQYGVPQWRTAFAVYSVCYRDGKLLEVSQKRFGLWRLGRDGALTPFKEEPPRPLPGPGAL